MMKTKQKLLRILPIALFSLSVAVTVQPALANRLTVSCVDDSGQPLRGVEVQIQEIQTQQRDSKKSNKQGEAQFRNLNPGLYRIWAHTEGYTPAFYEFVYLGEDSEEQQQLKFAPGDDRALYFEDAGLTSKGGELLNQGIEALRARQIAVAIEKLEAARDINPSSIDVFHNLALAYIDSGRFDEAKSQLDEEMRILKLFQQANFNPEAVNQRITALEQLVGLLPTLVLQREAEEAFRTQDYETAVARLSEISKAQPDNGSVLFNLATAQYQAEQFDAAMASINKALELEPDNQQMLDFQATVSKGKRALLAQRSRDKLAEIELLFKDGKYQEFIDAARALQGDIVDDFQPKLWLDMARAYTQLEQVDNAVAAYQKVIELVPNSLEFEEELAAYLLREERVDEAIEAYTEVLEKKNESVADGLYAIASDLNNKGNETAALKLWDRILEIDPDHAETHYSLGMAQYFAKDFEKAEPLLRKYLEIGTNQDYKDNVNSVLGVIEYSKKQP